MSAILMSGKAAAWPKRPPEPLNEAESAPFNANRDWEIDRALMLERSERRAWRVAVAGLVLGLIGIAAVFVQGPLRRVVEIPIVVDRVTGETTIQQRLSEETIPAMEALDKHNLAAFVRARESYSWMFLQRDFDQVARMAVPGVFAEYNRQFEGDGALQKKIGAAEEWRINIVGVAVVTDRRTHALRFVVLPDGDRQQPVYRLTLKAPAQPKPASGLSAKDRSALAALPPLPSHPTPQQVVAERLQASPTVMNSLYSLAEGAGSQDIVPTLVYDDGRFTYLRFPGNREVPAVFHVLGDGSETLVNARMEDDLLVVDRVSRQLMLRAGNAVVGIWNEAFDLDGAPAEGATTVPGVQRVLKAANASLDNRPTGVRP